MTQLIEPQVPQVRAPSGCRLASEPQRWAKKRTLVGQTIANKYRVRSVLGKGGMGTVYAAEHVALRRMVAIKVLRQAHAQNAVAVKRFHQEARAAASIGHPSLCDVRDYGVLPDGSPYIVMEHLEGETLGARIKREGALPLREVIDAVLQVASGLAAAHAQGILHRDIKADNVFLVANGSTKVLDFGVSKVKTPSEECEDAITKTGVVIGTPCYFAPEQARGLRDLDERVDVYACGVLLYEACTGRRPFDACHYNALLLSILTGNAPAPRALRASIPLELERIILKAMAKDREARHQSMTELSRDLVRARELLDDYDACKHAHKIEAPVAPWSTVSIEIPIYVDE